MVAQAVFNFQFERTEKSITPHGGLPFIVRYISGLRVLCGLNRFMSADALGDWLRRTGAYGLPGLGIISSHIISRIMKRDKRTIYTLDVDATEIVANKKTAQYTYNKNKGYMPMLGFLAENQICIHDE